MASAAPKDAGAANEAKEKDAKTTFTFDLAHDSPRFPAMEETILKEWEKKDTFRESLRRSKEAKLPEYMFYDGPPFATGMPHYGHILAGTIKDIVTRYAHQTGHHVERRFGWDCHGLPVEHEIDKKLGIKTKEDVLMMGIDRYNAECRSIVMRYSSAWRETITRCGRWIDFDNDYKTLDTKFMESVWWVFSQLHKKNLVYRGFKVMPYSTACTTPLSNFETAQNYQQVRDPSVIVNFPLLKDEKTCLLAWTTTPWTLPSNLGLCVNKAFTYVKVLDKKSGKNFILAKSRIPFVYREEGKAVKNEENGGKKKKKSKKKKKKKEKKERKKRPLRKKTSKPSIVTTSAAGDEGGAGGDSTNPWAMMDDDGDMGGGAVDLSDMLGPDDNGVPADADADAGPSLDDMMSSMLNDNNTSQLQTKPKPKPKPKRKASKPQINASPWIEDLSGAPGGGEAAAGASDGWADMDAGGGDDLDDFFNDGVGGGANNGDEAKTSGGAGAGGDDWNSFMNDLE
mmetsp:Transcript_20900/g.40492  ORF Transcript_20900/g.40492 Transcript_20900/m.40492 type:complete len:510 (-) Transcript_20900:171-1700(-)